jgi:hypothetical protein
VDEKSNKKRFCVSEVLTSKVRNEESKLFQVQMSSHYLSKKLDKKVLNITAVYATDPHLLRFLSKVKDFYNFASTLTFDVNTSLTQKRFLVFKGNKILLTRK